MDDIGPVLARELGSADWEAFRRALLGMGRDAGARRAYRCIFEQTRDSDSGSLTEVDARIVRHWVIEVGNSPDATDNLRTVAHMLNTTG